MEENKLNKHQFFHNCLNLQMSDENEQIYILHSRNLPVKIGLIVIFLIVIAFSWFAVRWQIGNLLADMSSPTEENIKSAAQTALNLAPNDPITNWLTASVKQLENPEYTAGFERVVRLSPNDYRWWIQLGRSYEEANKPVEAEKAFLKAIEIAPNYTYPHWQIGNFYLRENEPDKAFKELKKAADNNDTYREQIFSIAWDYYDQNTEKLEAIVGDSSDSRAGLARFYAAKESPRKSLEIWNTLTADEKKVNEKTAALIAQSFYDKRFFLSSVEFVNQLGIEKNVKAETVTNGGFEDEIANSDRTYFSWRIIPTEKMRVAVNPIKKHGGKKSLQVSFNDFNGLDINNIFQTIAVKPGVTLQLSFWVKTEDLKSAGNPKLDILSSNDGKSIISSEAFAEGTTDWKQYDLKFTVPADTEGIGLRTSRAFCGEKCPLFGTFWYDDFELKKLSGE